MKKTLIGCFFLVTSMASLYAQNSSVESPKPMPVVPTKAQIEWQKMEQYAFIHFGLNTFNDMEWGFGDTPATTFDPKNLDADQWVETIKKAGLKGIILTAKHHDGFCLWPSKYTEYSVKNSPWKNGKGDMVREFLDACKKYDLKVGLYLSPWDRNHAQYGHPEYTEYFNKQIAELIEEYCDDVDLFEYWFDGANGGDGYYGGAREKRSIDPKVYYQYERGVKTIKNKFPDAMIFGGTQPDVRWIGNESGWAGQTNWSTWNLAAPESKQLMYGKKNGEDWLPGEVDVSIRPGWFYHAREDHQLHSLSTLVDFYYQSVGRNANLLLNFPVSLTGKIADADSARVVEWWQTIQAELKDNLLKDVKVEVSQSRGGDFGAEKINDGDWDSYWATSDDTTTASVTFTFKKPTQLNRLLLQEYIPLGQRVAAFNVEYLHRNKWEPISTADTMSTIGYKRILRFENITTTKLRVNITEAKAALTINNIEAFLAPALLVEPRIRRNAAGEVAIAASDRSTKLYYTTDGTTPTEKSTPYTKPFKIEGKATVKAIGQDASDKKRFSDVSFVDFDVLPTNFKVEGVEKTQAMFDSNPNTVYTMPKEVKELKIDLGKEYNLRGFTYLPSQSRWGGGYITLYEVWAGDKKVADGEFSNIAANPILQVVEFQEPVTTNKLRFVVKGFIGQEDPKAIAPSFAEFGVLTM